MAQTTITHEAFRESLPSATTIDPYANPTVRDARKKGMTVTAETENGVATGQYVVQAEDGTKTVVNMKAGQCGCGDTDSDSVCPHRRRVALSITHADVPAAGEEVRD